MFFKKLLFLLLLAASLDAKATQYIILARPTGSLANSLSIYWQAVRDNPRICHKAITKYPPHCTVTSFFTPDPTKTIAFYDNAIVAALNDSPVTAITVASNASLGTQTDYIRLTSTSLQHFAVSYIHEADLTRRASPKGQPGAFTFHVTLRDNVFDDQDDLAEIRRLQGNIHFWASAGWAICLYKCENEIMTELTRHVIISP